MRIPAPLRTLAACALALAMVGAAQSARAQAAAVIGPIFSPSRSSGQRGPQQQPFWISRADCINDDVMNFSVSFTSIGPVFQVWAGNSGTDCTTAMNRTTAPICWELFNSQPLIAQNYQVPIKVRDIVGHHLPQTSSGTPTNGQIIPGTLSDCLPASASPPAPVVLYFGFINGDQLQGVQTYQTSVDIWGPNAATNLTAGSGETRLHLDWSRPLDTDVVRYDFYCDPPLGAVTDAGATTFGLLPPLPGLHPFAFDSGVGGAVGTGGFVAATGGAGGLLGGTGGAGGASGTGGSILTSSDAGTTPTVAATCNALSPIIPGKTPTPAMDPYKCGSSLGIAATSGTAEGLKNGTAYTVAVVAVDQVENPGAFSNQACATPQEVTDFFEFYRQNGGTAGGGFCAMATPRRGPGAGELALFGLAVAFAWRRRVRR